MIFLIVFVVIVSTILIWHFTTKSFINPYTFTFIFGKKGSGKSTLLTKIAYENLKKGRAVYSTEYISFPIFDKKKNKLYDLETIPIEAGSIFDYSFPAGSLILIDEASLIWSNRDFAVRSKSEALRKTSEFFQLQRRNKLTVVMFSVTFDIDKKIRDMCDEMYIVNKVARVFVFAKRLIRKPIVVHPSAESPARIDEDILSDPVLFYPFGGLKTAFIPSWTKYYKSFLTDGANTK